MKFDKKIATLCLAAMTITGVTFAALTSGKERPFVGGLNKSGAPIYVNTPYSLILNESWGYNGESEKDQISERNNHFTFGFSNSFSSAGGGYAFSTTADGQYIYNLTELNSVSQIYVKGSSTNAKTGVTIYGHYYDQTECLDDSETISGSLNQLIDFSPTKYVAIKFEGIDNIESIEIGYSCAEPSDPCRHLVYGGAHADNNGYHQSYMGFSTDLPVGTNVTVEMDVSVSGSFVESSGIYWVDDVYTTSGGESDKARTNITSTIINGVEGWHHISFIATVRNFPNLRFNTKFTTQDTSSFGNAVYVITQNKSKDAFNYRNVSVTANYLSMVDGGSKSNGYHQTFAGLSTDLPVGSTVLVEMDVLRTGSFDQYSSVGWVNSIQATEGDAAYVANRTSLRPEFGIEGNVAWTSTDWQHVSFEAKVGNYPQLRKDNQYSVYDTSSFGNAVYLITENKDNKSFDYKNVSMIEKHSMVDGGSKSNGYHQTFAGLSTDLPVGSTVLVEMDVLRTGSFDQYSSVGWVNSIQATEGGAAYVANRTSLRPEFGIEGNVAWTSTDWQHVSFEAKVGNYPQLRKDNQYSVYDTSSFGNAVYLITENKDNKSFDFRNVEIVGKMTPSGNNNNSKDMYYQSIAGLSANHAVGTEVTVEMDVQVTGTFNSYSRTFVAETVYSVAGGELDGSISLDSYIDYTDKTNWQHISFAATVRNFPALRRNSAYPVVDTSSVGNGVYLIAMNKSADSFNFKNVSVETEIEKYKIVVADALIENSSSPTLYAANVLKNCIAEAGVELEIVSDFTSKTPYEFVVGQTKRYSSGSLGAESYHIKNYGTSLHIDALDKRGVIYGVYAWLESVGFRFYAKDVTKVPSLNDIKVSEINKTFVPSFNYRELVFKDSFDTDLGVSFGTNGFIGKDSMKEAKYGGYYGYINGNARIHSSIGNPTENALVDKVYIDGLGAESHPEWFARKANGDSYVTDHEDFADTQLCLSNNELLERCKTWLIWRIQSVVAASGYDGQSPRIMVSQMDNDNYCKCDDCMALYAQYGTTGAWLNWVNQLARHVKTTAYSYVNIETLAYSWTKELPLGGIVPEDNVTIRFCSDFGGCVHDRANSTSLAHEKELLEGWFDICDNVNVHYYATHYSNHLEAYPSFDDIYYNFKYMHEVGVNGIYSEGFLDNNGEFGELRSYLISQMMKNPSMSYSEYNSLIASFCNYYYGDAGQYVLNYIGLMKNAVKADIGCRGKVDNTTFNFTDSLKNSAEGYWDMGEAAVSDPTLLYRVQKSRLHWTFTMLENYESSFESSDYSARVQQLAASMIELNVRHVNHAQAITGDVSDLGVYVINPRNWLNHVHYTKEWAAEAE